MAVRFHNHQRLYKRRKPEIDAAIARVIASGRFDWGDEVPAFEAEFAAWVGAAYAVCVNSGTAALKVALLALDIGPGDEVITVGNTDIASSSSIHHTGGRPVWVEIDPVSKCMDVDALRAAITPRTRAILPVDLYGHPADMKAIMTIAREHNLVVVEDACLSLGATIDGQKIGTFADITCFSFAPVKTSGQLRQRRCSRHAKRRTGRENAQALCLRSGAGPPLHHAWAGRHERPPSRDARAQRAAGRNAGRDPARQAP